MSTSASTPAENRFSMAIARRVTADAEPVLTQETGFHPRTRALTKSFVEYRGYWLPHCFDNEGAVAEYWACRERAVVMDLSPLRKWEVLGPDAETAHAADAHPRRPPAGGGPGELHRAVQRDRRHDRRRARSSASARTTSASSAATPTTASGSRSRPSASGLQGVRQAVDRPAAQPRRAGARGRATSCARSSGRRRRRPRSRTCAGSASSWADRRLRRRSRSSCRAPATPASSATRSSATPTTAPAVWDAVLEAGAPHGVTPLGLEALDMCASRRG